MLSLRLFNGFRILSEKCEDAEDLKNYVESLAFKHLGIEAAAGGGGVEGTGVSWDVM